MTQPTLTEIAKRINGHLTRFEADPKINVRNATYQTQPYYHAGAYRAGAYVQVWYVSYQGKTNLKRDEAVRYLAWLDAGNVGSHYTAFRKGA